MTDRHPSNLAVVAPSDQAPAGAEDWDLQPVIDWLVRDGRMISDPARLVEALADSYLEVTIAQTVALNNQRTAAGILTRRMAASVGTGSRDR